VNEKKRRVVVSSMKATGARHIDLAKAGEGVSSFVLV
jgi:hypothetical protein